jgi:very-short-patch-repair endonuclease
MTGSTLQSPEIRALVRAQHGVVSRGQLAAFGLTRHAIAHGVATGRLHVVCREVYAVGRPELTVQGRWMAAVLTCGPGAVLSHAGAAALWGIAPVRLGPISVSVPVRRCPGRRRGIVIHRRSALGRHEVTSHEGIPVTTPTATLIDIATTFTVRQLERAVNEADTRDLIDPETLRASLDDAVRRPGTAALRRMLDRAAYTRTDSDLERRFLRLARAARLPKPRTQAQVNGFRVDFHWPELGLVVETDGLRYHRTPAQQARDRLRDQTHTAAGLTTLRFTHAQVAHESERVMATLAKVAHRLSH